MRKIERRETRRWQLAFAHVKKIFFFLNYIIVYYLDYLDSISMERYHILLLKIHQILKELILSITLLTSSSVHLVNFSNEHEIFSEISTKTEQRSLMFFNITFISQCNEIQIANYYRKIRPKYLLYSCITSIQMCYGNIVYEGD